VEIDGRRCDVWQTVGLTTADERVYRALLREPEIGAADCAGTLEISPQRFRAAVRRLATAGLVEYVGPAPGRPRPVDPRVALGSLIRGRQGDLDRLAADVDQLATEFYNGRLRADPSLVIEVIEGEAAIKARFRDLLTGAGRDIVCLDAPPYVMDSDECEALEVAALRRGVRFRSLYATTVFDNPEKHAYIDAMVGAGEQARLLRTVPLKLFVVDGETAIVPLTVSEKGSRFRSVVVRRSTLTNALDGFFEVLWRQATPWPGAPPTNGSARRRTGGSGLTDDDRALLRYLASGMKDEALARHLGCSRRTLRRRTDTLLDKLGATSRFQAGALAAQRGWL
jgi:sugar-specific transcriptional regulator TrmB/DNA-binding CsgD family transcriptional regulator